MARSRSRSRSRRGGDRREDRRDDRDDKRGDPKKDGGVAEASKSGSSEQEIVSVAIKQLPGDIRERLQKLFEEGLLKEGDLDLRAITVFASLNEGLQARVMNHMEGERIYVANARSKSGFLIATCDKAKTGCLDARGLGAIDPWRTALVAMATPKQKMVDLKPERDWLDQNEAEGPIKINVDVTSVESELGVPRVTVELPLSETSAAVKAKLVAMGVSIPANRMKLHTDPVGFLKERHSFAFYNLSDGVTLTLSARKRAGTRFRADHTTMPKRPKAQPAMAPPKPAGMLGLPGLPALPKFPGLPGLPGLPGMSMSALGGAGMAPGGLAGLTGLLDNLRATGGAGTAPSGLAGLAGLTMPGGLAGLPGLSMPSAGLGEMAKAKAPVLPGLVDSKAPGGLPGLPGLAGLPGLSLPGGGDPLAAMKAMMEKMKAGGPPPAAPPGLMLPSDGVAKSMSKAVPFEVAMPKMPVQA